MFVGGLAAIGGLRADVSASGGRGHGVGADELALARRLREDRGWSDEQVRVWPVRLTAGPA